MRGCVRAGFLLNRPSAGTVSVRVASGSFRFLLVISPTSNGRQIHGREERFVTSGGWNAEKASSSGSTQLWRSLRNFPSQYLTLSVPTFWAHQESTVSNSS